MNKVFIKSSMLFFCLLIFAFPFVSEAQPKQNNSKTAQKQDQQGQKVKPTSQQKQTKTTKPKTPPAPTPEENAIDQITIDSILAIKDVNERVEKLKAFTEARPTSSFVPLAKEHISLEEIKAITDLNERIEKLKTFVADHPDSKLKSQALELLSSSRATLGDERLKYGDSAGGVELFRLAVSEAPENSSDNFFDRVLSQIPVNLFWRSEQKAAYEFAKIIEEKSKDNPTRLLAIEAFYLGVEDADNALRVAQTTIKLAPNMSAAYQGLGAAYRISFKLDEAAEAYAKAAELDLSSTVVRRSLADLRRAQGRDEEAILLYRGLLQADKEDEFARMGFIMSLFNMGKREDAEKELAMSLEANPNSLAILTNAAYWYAANNEGEKAVQLAQKAAQIEPRYVWAHVALARGYVATKQPLEAEKVLMYAKQYGSFPTLDYELATVLTSLGLYEEATQTLSRSFAIKDGMLETKLGGRAPAKASNFIELLAPERRASIFQSTAADTENNAKLLKNLLAFSLALNPEGGKEARKEEDITVAAKELASGDDAMRTHRQLYVASRLIQNDVALSQAQEITQAATSGVEASLDVPAPTVAVMADELYEVRSRAAAYGRAATYPPVQRNILSNIMRGRIEDIAGWSLFNQNKANDAIVRLKRAVGVLPENSVWWRNAMWHLGAAHEATGNQQEALAAYYKSYNSSPDATRRVIIESLYKKANGTLEGLDTKIGPSPFAPTTKPTPTNDAANANMVSVNNPVAEPSPSPSTENNQTAPPASTSETAVKAENQPSTETKPTPTTENPQTENKLPANSGPVLTKTQEQKDATLPELKLKPVLKTESSTPPTSLAETKPEPTPSPETKTETQTTQPKESEIKTEPTPVPSPEASPTNETKTEVTNPPSKTETKVEAKTEPTPTTENKSENKIEKSDTPTQAPEVKQDAPTSTENKQEANKQEANPMPSPSPVTGEKSSEPTTKQDENKPSQEQTAKVENKTDETASKPSQGEETKTQTETKPETTPAKSDTENKADENASKPRVRVITVKPANDSNVQIEDKPKQETETPKQEEATAKQTRPRRVNIPNEQTNEDASKQTPVESTETKPATEETKPCVISLNQEEVSIINNGGTIAVTLTFDGMTFDEKKITTDFDWANINVFMESKKTDGRSALYTIVSASKNTGTYKVVFKTPCGSKELIVKVR